MTTPGISVALCTYNGERFLEAQLASVALQTRRPDEVVVCDDASTDRTVDVVRRFVMRHELPIRLYENDANLGSTKNFEKAISLARFDIIALCDQDDVWDRDKLARAEDAMLTSNLGAIFSDAEVVDENLHPQGYTMWQSIRFGADDQARFQRGRAFEVLLRRNVVTGTTFAFRARIRDIVLPIPERWIHDGWIAILVAATGTIGMLDNSTVWYRQHADNQIGGVRSSRATEVLGNLRATRISGGLREEADRYEEVRDRLLQVGFEGSEAVGRLEQKVAHMRFRASLPSHRLARVSPVLHQLRSGSYSAYSRGWLSAAKDLVVKT